MSALSVLSVNCSIMGHAAYQLSLEAGFPNHAPTISFESVRLPEVCRSDLLGRLAYRLLTVRLPGWRDSDWDWYRMRSELASSLFLRRWLRRRLSIRRPDVLHIHTQSIALLACDILRQTPSVISMDCTSALLARLHAPPARRTYRPIIALERRCLAAAKHVVCWSDVTRNSVVEDYGIHPENVSVIRPAVAGREYPQRAVLDDKKRKLRLLFVGNDFARKGGHDVVTVFRDHLQTTCELDVVSNGVERLPVADGLRLHRGLTSTSGALLQLYADADVFVMPTYEDAFGLVYVEAMAAGLPCIGTDVLAVPELVQHEVTGLTVEPGNHAQLRSAVERLQRDTELRRRLAAAGRIFAAQHCDTATNCVRLASIFRSAVVRHELVDASAVNDRQSIGS